MYHILVSACCDSNEYPGNNYYPVFRGVVLQEHQRQRLAANPIRIAVKSVLVGADDIVGVQNNAPALDAWTLEWVTSIRPCRVSMRSTRLAETLPHYNLACTTSHPSHSADSLNIWPITSRQSIVPTSTSSCTTVAAWIVCPCVSYLAGMMNAVEDVAARLCQRGVC